MPWTRQRLSACCSSFLLGVMRRWFDDSEGGTKPGVIKPEKCRAYTEEELASQEIQEGGWFNQVAFGVMRVSMLMPTAPAMECRLHACWLLHFHIRIQQSLNSPYARVF